MPISMTIRKRGNESCSARLLNGLYDQPVSLARLSTFTALPSANPRVLRRKSRAQVLRGAVLASAYGRSENVGILAVIIAELEPRRHTAADTFC